MKILELKTGLFPDATRVAKAIETLRGNFEIEQTDVSGLSPEDDDDWSKVVKSILSADRVITL